MTIEELQRRLEILEASLHARVSAIERVLKQYTAVEDELHGTMLDEIMRIKNVDVRQMVWEQWHGHR